MSENIEGIRKELRPMLSLAVPVVLAELGWMAMGVIDTVMVGRVGPEAIGAVGIGRAIFWGTTIFGIGLLLGLDTLVSRAFGARDLAACRRARVQGLYLSAAVSVPAALLLWTSPAVLEPWGIDPVVIGPTTGYVRAIAWCVPSMMFFNCLRRYLQAVNRARMVMVALTSANLINVVCNWVLIFGHLGAPRLGAAGAGWATTISCTYMALVLWWAVRVHDREEMAGLPPTPLAPDLAGLRRLLGLGLPAASQLFVELAVFAAATALAARLAPSSLAAHQIALTCAGVTFMVPLGISSAAAVRVGQALGRRDGAAARRAGWTALALGTGFMSVAALFFLVLPEPILRLFTADPRVLAIGVALLGVAALFQLFDGIQVVATGALRGAGSTRTALVWNLIGHWVLGLPVGYYLCFLRGWGVVGLWMGWVVGLTSVGAVLLLAWARRSRAFERNGG